MPQLPSLEGRLHERLLHSRLSLTSHTAALVGVYASVLNPIFRLPPSFRFTGCPVSYVNVTV